VWTGFDSRTHASATGANDDNVMLVVVNFRIRQLLFPDFYRYDWLTGQKLGKFSGVPFTGQGSKVKITRVPSTISAAQVAQRIQTKVLRVFSRSA
jgi:hypothetical protein